jgi:hypothetical protein
MDQVSALGLAIIVSLTFSTLIAIAIGDPLRRVLRQLCLDGADFCTSFTTVMLYITPLLFTLLFANALLADLVDTLRSALAASLSGGFADLLVVGYQISRARVAR